MSQENDRLNRMTFGYQGAGITLRHSPRETIRISKTTVLIKCYDFSIRRDLLSLRNIHI